MKKSFVVLVACAAISIAAIAAPGSGKQPAQPVPVQPITVGDFAVMVSQAIGAPATSPTNAIANLQARGLNMPLDLNATLTERQVVDMFHDLGVVNVRTDNPASAVTPEKAESILGGVNLSALSAASPLPADELPIECLQQRNRGKCNNCCQISFGCDLSQNNCPFGKTCAKFCQSVLPPGQQSPSEPEP